MLCTKTRMWSSIHDQIEIGVFTQAKKRTMVNIKILDGLARLRSTLEVELQRTCRMTFLDHAKTCRIQDRAHGNLSGGAPEKGSLAELQNSRQGSCPHGHRPLPDVTPWGWEWGPMEW
jgi:hypothetical protein